MHNYCLNYDDLSKFTSLSLSGCKIYSRLLQDKCSMNHAKHVWFVFLKILQDWQNGHNNYFALIINLSSRYVLFIGVMTNSAYTGDAKIQQQKKDWLHVFQHAILDAEPQWSPSSCQRAGGANASGSHISPKPDHAGRLLWYSLLPILCL